MLLIFQLHLVHISGGFIIAPECSVPSGTCTCSNERTSLSDLWWSSKGLLLSFGD